MSNQFWNQGAYQTQNYTSTQNDFYSGLDNPNFDNDLMNRQVNNNTNNSGGGRNKYIKNVQNQGQIGYLSYQESEPVDSEDLDSFKVELVTIRDKLKKSKKIDFLRGISLANEYLIATLNGTIGTEEQKEVFDELGIYAFLSALKKNSRFANPKIVKQINNFFQRSIHLVLKLLPNDPRGKVSRLILTLFTQSVYQYDYTLNSMKNNFVYFTKRELFEKEELPLNFYQSDSEGSDNEDLNQQKKQKKKKVQIEFQSKKSRKQNQKLREQILHGSSKPKIVYILPRNYYTPLLLLENIELFGRENGFQKICNLLSKPLFDNFDFTNLAPKKISEFFKNKIDIVKYSIRAVCMVRHFLKPKFIKKLAANIQELAYERLIELWNVIPDSINLLKIISSILKYLEKIQRRNTDYVTTKVSTLKFFFSLKESVMSGNHPYVEQDTLLLYLFHSSINKVNELISKSKDHDLSKSKRKRNQIASVELEKILSNFIIEKKILEIYLDEKISPEYLELLSQIFSFMSRANKVNGKILKKLWNQSLNQKLSIEIRERLHILIKRYISNVGDSEGMFIFEKYIKKLKKEDYKFPLIDLVYTITEACLKRIKSEKLKNFQSYGLKLFWDMFQEDSGVDVYLSTFARENLQKILKMPQFKLERKNYIDLCIKNINEQKSVLLSLELIRALLIYEAKSKHNIQETQYHLIMKVRQLEKKHNLFDSFIKEFTQYWKLGTIALNNLKNGNFSKNEENEIKIKVDNDNTNECKNNEKENKKKEKGNIKMEKDKEKEKEKEFIFIDSKTILVGQIEHKKQMSYRMNFFNFLTCNCKVPLQYKHIEQLWKILIDKPISKNDKSLLINWLFNIDFVNIDGESTLNSSAITKLFTDKISNFDMDDYSSKEFSIFEKFFRYLNIKKQKIEPEYKTIEINNPYEEEMYFPRMKRTEKVLTGKFLLASTNLWQAEALWNLIMNVKPVDIANKAIRFYVDLYFCLEKSTINNRSARNKYFNSLINQSVNILLEQLKIGKIKQKRIIENTNLINNNNNNNNNNNTSQNDQDLIEMNNIENRINRVLQFLQFFIKRYDNKFGLKKLLKKDLTRHEDRIGKIYYRIKALFVEKNIALHFFVHRDSLVTELRISIGYWLQVNPDALSLKFNGTKLELSYYFKTLKQIFIDDDSIIYISIRNNVELNILAFDKELAFETIEGKNKKKMQENINSVKDKKKEIEDNEEVDYERLFYGQNLPEEEVQRRVKKLRSDHKKDLKKKEKKRIQKEKDLKKRQKKIEEQEQQQKKKELKKISDRFPAWILVNQHFDIFIQLFEFSINISHEVRGLLLLLPTHSKLLDTFINTSKLINNINNKQDNQNSKDNKVQDNYSNLNVEEKNDNDNLKKKINWDYLIPNKPPSLTLYSLEIIWMQIFKYRPYSFVNDKKDSNFYIKRPPLENIINDNLGMLIDQELIKNFINTGGMNRYLTVFQDLLKDLEALFNNNKFEKAFQLITILQTQLTLFEFLIQNHFLIDRPFTISDIFIDFIQKNDNTTKIIIIFVNNLLDFIKSISNLPQSQDNNKYFDKLNNYITLIIGLIVRICYNSKPIFDNTLLKFKNFNNWIECTLLNNHNIVIKQLIKNFILKLCNFDGFDVGQNRLFNKVFNELIKFLPNIIEYRTTSLEYFDLLLELFQSPKVPIEYFQNNQTLLIDLINKTNSMETFEKEDDDDDDEDQKEEGVKKKRVNNKSKIVNNADNVDTALAGLLKLISLLYQNKETFNLKFNKEIEQVFVKDIFCTYLFSLINKNHKFYGTLPKCKAFLTRESAFKMLSNLIKTDINNFSILLPFIYKQINRIDYNKEWADHDKKQNLNEFETFQIQDNIHNFVGLTNQSATCYMNSVLQQLYAVLDFRKEILSTALPEIPENQLSDAGKVLRELQIVFHSLKDKQIRYFNTRKFCQVFKWTDNQPINVTQQQDANEFLNLLFNFIDEGLRECSQQRLFHDVFGGSLIHQVICQQEQHKSERIEQFYTVSLDVKNKSHLLESLSSFIQPDHLIDDNAYHCSRCSKKVNALKRCSFLALPNTLILHLKRFDFDLQTLTMTKINSRLEFPFNLDMKPYTLEGIIEDEKKRRKNKKKQKLLKKNKTGNENEQDNNNDDEEDGDMDYDDSESDMSSDEDNELDGIQVENRPGSYYKYKIIGIVVHSGTHNFGHYYSYIRDHHQEFKIGNEGEQGNENGMDKEKIKEKEIIEELNNNILIDEVNIFNKQQKEKQKKNDQSIVEIGNDNEENLNLIDKKDTSSDENNSIDDKDKKDKIDKGVWNEFNDVRVTAFDIDTIDENAYGSNEIKIDENEKEGLRKYNAYMLVYQRVEYFEAKKKEEIGIIEEEQLKLEKEKEKLKEQEEEKKKQEELEKEEEEEQKRLQVIDENEIDEKQLIKLYQPEYIDFLWDLIQQDLTKIDKQYFKEQIEKQLIKNNKGIKINNNNNDDDEDPIFLIIKLATIYALDVISHSKNRDKLEKWITQLQYYYHSYHSKALIWFIKTTYYRKWIQKILCECPFNQVKEAFAELFKTVISRLAFEEKAFYSQTYRGSSLFEFDETLLLSEEDKIKEQQQLNTKSDPIIIPSSYALRIIQYCFDTLFRTDWKKSSPKYILNILSHFATLGNEEVKFLVSLDSIHKLSNFFVINCSIPIKEIIQKRKTREEQRKQLSLIYREEELQYFLPLDDPNEIGHVEANDYADLILMFSKMIRSCKIIPTSQLGTMEFNSNQPILIEEQMPEYTNFLAEAIQNKIEIKEITLLMQFLSYNNHNLSIHFINLCMEPIRSYLNHSINHAEYINILKQIIQINDEYQNFRVENIMSNLFQLARQITTQNQSKGKELCQHIFTFPKIPIINNWLQNNNWVVQETINSVGLSYRK